MVNRQFHKENTDATLRETTAQVEEHKASDTPISKTPIGDRQQEKLQQNLHKIEKAGKKHEQVLLIKNFYITDSSTTIDNSIFQVRTLLTKSMVIKIKKGKRNRRFLFFIHMVHQKVFVTAKKEEKKIQFVGVGARH